MNFEIDRKLGEFLRNLGVAYNLTRDAIIREADPQPRTFSITLPGLIEKDQFILSESGIITGFRFEFVCNFKAWVFRIYFHLLRPTEFEKYFYRKVITENTNVKLGEAVGHLTLITERQKK